MSKKIYFGKLADETVVTLNELAEVIFATTTEARKLSVDMKAATANLAKAKSDGVESVVEYNNAINLISNKRTALNAYKKEALFGVKDTDNNGLMGKLGITSDLHSAYITMQTEGKRGEYLKSIKNILSSLGMDTSEKLTANLANKLQFVVGNKVASSSAIVQGKFTKQEGFSVFAQIFALSMLEYIADTCEKVTIYKAEFYNVSFTYGKNVKFEKYEITGKEADAE